MSGIILRPYQKECLESISKHYSQGIKRQIVSLPTAAGKTVIFAHLIEKLKCRTLVLAHTCELLEQAKEKIQMICPGLAVGIVDAKRKEFEMPIVISSIQSARQSENLRKLQEQKFQLLIADECHHFGADSPRMVLDALGFSKDQCKGKLLIGFSATPYRSDGRGLGEIFDKVVYEKDIKELIEEGYLCKPKGIKVATDLDLSKVQTDDGDFSAASLSKVMDNPQINNLIVQTYIENAQGRKAICFGTTVAHAENIAKAFKACGIQSDLVHGALLKDERETILNRFKNDEISILCNCNVLVEGFDSPSVDCVIIGRPTKSKGLYCQMAGRGLRLFPNKSDCLILDFGDQNHSLCNTALLIGDAECVEYNKPRANSRMVSLAQTLPPTINQKLKKAILEFDPLGNEFVWMKDDTGYSLKGSGTKILKVFSIYPDKYNVVFFNGIGSQEIASNLSFDYAFSAAEDFAKSNRHYFSVSDLEASWRNDPISEKQLTFFKKNGFRAGISDLTKGQAATIISSGILNKKASRNTYQRL